MINVFIGVKIPPAFHLHRQTNMIYRGPDLLVMALTVILICLTFTVYTVLLTVDIYHIVEFKLLCQRAVFYHTLDLLLV